MASESRGSPPSPTVTTTRALGAGAGTSPVAKPLCGIAVHGRLSVSAPTGSVMSCSAAQYCSSFEDIADTVRQLASREPACPPIETEVAVLAVPLTGLHPTSAP